MLSFDIQRKMPSSRFEDLPNEIIRQVFSYLSPQDLMEGWASTNDRMDKLIYSLHYNISLVGRNVTIETVAAAYVFREQVVSLVVTKRWCDMIKYYRNLQALRVLGLAPQFAISQITPEMMPHLKYVEYGLENLHWNEFMGRNECYYGRQIVRCHVHALNALPTVCCPTLRSVHIQACSSEWLAALLRVAPNLTDIDTGLHTDISFDLTNLRIVGIQASTTKNEHSSFVPTPTAYFDDVSHNQLRRIKLRFDCNTTLKWLDGFLRSTPNVTHFSLSIARSYEVLSFEEFHRIITHRLPKLIPEEFRFEYSCLQKPFDLEQHRTIGSLFQNMMVKTETFAQFRISLLTISVNWQNINCVDIYDDLDFEDDFAFDDDGDDIENEIEDS